MGIDTNTLKILKVASEPMRELLAIIISKKTQTDIEDVRKEINDIVHPVPDIE